MYHLLFLLTYVKLIKLNKNYTFKYKRKLFFNIGAIHKNKNTLHEYTSKIF